MAFLNERRTVLLTARRLCLHSHFNFCYIWTTGRQDLSSKAIPELQVLTNHSKYEEDKLWKEETCNRKMQKYLSGFDVSLFKITKIYSFLEEVLFNR
jgi:hypothetical protein